MEVALEFIQRAVQPVAAKLLPVTPNPSTGPVVASFFLPESANITLSLSNLNGGAVANHSAYFEAGWHQVEMPVGAAVSGIYFLQLQTPFGNETRRVAIDR